MTQPAGDDATKGGCIEHCFLDDDEEHHAWKLGRKHSTATPAPRLASTTPTHPHP